MKTKIEEFNPKLVELTTEKRLDRLEGEMGDIYNLILNNQKCITEIFDCFEKGQKELVKEFERIEKLRKEDKSK